MKLTLNIFNPKIKNIKVFTTRPDTIFGASFLAVSVDHPICVKFLKDAKYDKFKKECLKVGTTEEALANAEKIGYETKLFAKHPFIKNKKLPIYVANFVFNGLRNRSYIWMPGS